MRETKLNLPLGAVRSRRLLFLVGLPVAVVAVSMLWVSVHAFSWLATPWGGARDHHLAAWEAWHGRLMVVAWSVLIPLGILAARFFKIWPGQLWPQQLDDRRWWHLHLGFQVGGIAAATVGVALVLPHARLESALARLHAVLGWMIMVAGWAQIASGLLRGTKGGPTAPRADGSLNGDHFMMTRRRLLFEHVHKSLGYLAIGLVLLTVPVGLALADAPRWMWLLIAIWLLCLAVAAIHLQRAGRCVDTYQAIWGPSPDLPGSSLRPVGFGITRRSSQ